MKINEISSYKSAINKIEANENHINKIIRTVTLNQNTPYKRVHTKRIIPIVAAAIIMLTGFTVYAAGNSILNIVFGNSKEYEFSDNLTGEIEVHSLKSHIDGLKVTPIGYASDSYTIYTVFQLDFPSQLPSYDSFREVQLDGYGHTNIEFIELLKRFSTNGHPSGGCLGSYVKKDDNTLYYIFTISCDSKMSGKITLDMNCLNLAHNNAELIKDCMIYDEQLFSATFSVEIQDVDGIKIITDDTEYDKLNICIYPCSIVIDSDDFETVNNIYRYGTINPYMPAHITLKNGKEITIKGYSMSYQLNNTVININSSSVNSSSGLPQYSSFDYRGYLSEPVNPKEIKSMTIYEQTLYAE